MPWYWVAAILCAVIGPFEAMYTYNRMRTLRDQRRRQAEERKKKEDTEDGKMDQGTFSAGNPAGEGRTPRDRGTGAHSAFTPGSTGGHGTAEE